jgi:hypothetical protein
MHTSGQTGQLAISSPTPAPMPVAGLGLSTTFLRAPCLGASTPADDSTPTRSHPPGGQMTLGNMRENGGRSQFVLPSPSGCRAPITGPTTFLCQHSARAWCVHALRDHRCRRTAELARAAGRGEPDGGAMALNRDQRRALHHVVGGNGPNVGK